MSDAIERERRQAAAALDWAEIDAELHDTPWLDEYREQRFYPLKQVVEIFSSGEPEALTVEVRACSPCDHALCAMRHAGLQEPRCMGVPVASCLPCNRNIMFYHALTLKLSCQVDIPMR